MNRTNKSSITRKEYLALIGLRVLSDKYIRLIEELETVVQEITGEMDFEGEPEKHGHGSDYLWGSRELDDMLSILSLKVIE